MISKLNEILEGWANVVKDQFNAVDPQTKEKSCTWMFSFNHWFGDILGNYTFSNILIVKKGVNKYQNDKKRREKNR